MQPEIWWLFTVGSLTYLHFIPTLHSLKIASELFNLSNANNLQSIKTFATGNPIKNILFLVYISFCQRKRWVEIIKPFLITAVNIA